MEPPDRLSIAASRECTASQLRRATRVVTRLYDEVMAASGLEGTQFSVLVALSLMGEVPMRQLADRLGIDRTTLTRNLKPLARQGLVESADTSDQRVRPVRLTAAGKKVLKRALPLWEEAQHRVVKKMGYTRWYALLALLEAVQELG
jgi:DNA-binding MarR family transcriptional regulator